MASNTNNTIKKLSLLFVQAYVYGQNIKNFHQLTYFIEFYMDVIVSYVDNANKFVSKTAAKYYEQCVVLYDEAWVMINKMKAEAEVEAAVEATVYSVVDAVVEAAAKEPP